MATTTRTVTIDVTDDDRYSALVGALDEYATRLEGDAVDDAESDRYEGRTESSPLTTELQRSAAIARELAHEINPQLDG